MSSPRRRRSRSRKTSTGPSRAKKAKINVIKAVGTGTGTAFATGAVAASGQLPLLPLHTLGWKGFQDLCGTILREVLGQTYSVWSPSSDAGRDGVFVGRWQQAAHEIFEGEFVAQCKHSSSDGASLTMSAVVEELAKVEALRRAKRVDVYLLFTNLRATGEFEVAFSAEMRKRGIKRWLLFGDHWMSAQVYESARLRALVPRVYGIGDLSQVIDERAYEQARAVLASFKDEIKTFVPVDAYRRACAVLEEHGFVFLVGEPGSGKSTIAAILTLLAADQWKLAPLRVHSPQEFEHWNPTRSDQVFWIDDAFGDIQYEASKTLGWRERSRDMRAAVSAGARFILTSRDYVFRRALNDFQKGDLPVADISKVQILVEALTTIEKETILYNHIKLGTQPKSFRTAIKGHLPLVALRAHMLPEVAKRLAAPIFTENLALTQDAIAKFAADPDQYLLSVLRQLDRSTRAAMILLFAAGGRLVSPLVEEPGSARILSICGVSIGDVKDSLAVLRNTLVRFVETSSESYWTYRHPTIHDAISSYVAEDPELVGTYIQSAGIPQIVEEVYFAGENKPEGACVAVPRHLYQELMRRIVAMFDDAVSLPLSVLDFLASRADRAFLQLYIATSKNLDEQLLEFNHHDVGLEIALMERMNTLGLLSVELRARLIARIEELAAETPNSWWLESSLLSNNERKQVLATVTATIDPYDVVSDWREGYDRADEPQGHFQPLLDVLDEYKSAFEMIGDESGVGRIEETRSWVWSRIANLEEDYVPRKKQAQMIRMIATEPLMATDASRFDDLDE